MTKKYFLTGATGAIGSALIPLLLEDVNSQVWALIRADSAEHLKSRLEELIVFWEFDIDQARDARQRVIPLMGDTDQEQFALPDEVYCDIFRQCSHIIHCAGVVRMNLPLEVARRHALGSVKNIVELALACQVGGQLQKVEYVSTVGVAGRMEGLVPEAWIVQSREFHNTYEQSKAEAEDYLREQIERYHLPITVHRPSMVVGDSKTGKIIHYQIFYYLCDFISGRKTFGVLPSLGKATLDLVSVDYVAQAIKWSAEQGENTANKVFHLCTGPKKAIRLTELQKLVRVMMLLRGVELNRVLSVSPGFLGLILGWLMFFVPFKIRRFLKTLPIFLDYLADDQLFESKNTEEFFKVLSGPVIQSPDTYLNIVLERYLDNHT